MLEINGRTALNFTAEFKKSHSNMLELLIKFFFVSEVNWGIPFCLVQVKLLKLCVKSRK